MNTAVFQSILRRTKRHVIGHKIASGVVAVLLVTGGYFGYRSLAGDDGEIRYVLAAAERGTLVVSVSGSGQVSSSNQVDVKPKASGDIIAVAVENGGEVRAGALLLQLDARNAQKAVRDAETNLESVRIALRKLEQPADTLSLLQAENSLTQSRNDLAKAYEDGFNAVSDAFLDLPTIMTGLNDILFSNTLSSTGGQWNIDAYMNAVLSYDERARQYRDDALAKYQAARAAYDKNFERYKATSRLAGEAQIEALVDETYATTKAVAEAVKSTTNLIQFYKDRLAERTLKPSAVADTHLASLGTYTGDANAHLSGLLSIRDSIPSTKRAIAERAEALEDLKRGADPLDLESSRLTVKQRENALLDARENLANYSVRAPFDGIVAKVNAKKGDSASSGTAVVTLIAKQRLAEIALNEVDVAKAKVGQKVTLTFDAVEGLSITGEVAEIDAIGTVTQGVVTYTVKIALDTQDERIKPGMSVSAAIVTDAKQDVLMVPNSAVKQQNDTAYVEITASENQTPQRQTVQVGLSNDTMTEIISGLNEGDRIVTQTITQTTTQNQPQQNTGIRIPGITGGGGGGVRGGGGFGR